jgi:solute carrier family 25 carnitine/acylcarnitine transporter 20/29
MDNTNNTFEMLGIGSIIGISQSIIGYPFDTIKTQLQSGTPFKSIDFLNPRQLYKGIKYQLYISTINTSLTFYIFDKIHSKTNSSILAGASAGIVSGLIINPLEIYKVRAQTHAQTLKQDIHNVISKTLGLKYTMSREILAFTTYFSVYTKLKERDNAFPTAINGGLAGCASWSIGYPMDTIKTFKQLNMNSMNSTIKLNSISRIKLLYRGFSVCMFRAFLVNSINFTIYEYFQSVCTAASSSGSS